MVSFGQGIRRRTKLDFHRLRRCLPARPRLDARWICILHVDRLGSVELCKAIGAIAFAWPRLIHILFQPRRRISRYLTGNFYRGFPSAISHWPSGYAWHLFRYSISVNETLFTQSAL